MGLSMEGTWGRLTPSENWNRDCCCCSFSKSCPNLCKPMDCSMPDFAGVCANSCPLSQWCHPTFSSSVTLFSFCLQSFPASGSFPMSRLFASGGQSAGASASVLPMSIQGWLPLGLPSLISLQSKGVSRVFSSTIIGKHQFFGTLPSLWTNSHICTWLLEDHSLDYTDLCQQSDIFAF